MLVCTRQHLGKGHAGAAVELTVLSGEDRLDRVAHAGTIAPLARACTGTLRALPPRKFAAPLDMASAALTVSLSTRRNTVTCCSEFLAGCFRAAAAPNTPHAEYLNMYKAFNARQGCPSTVAQDLNACLLLSERYIPLDVKSAGKVSLLT